MPNAPVTTQRVFLLMVLPFVGDLRRSVSYSHTQNAKPT